MSALSSAFRVWTFASVILLLHGGVAWAEETTARGASGTAYAGGGTLTVPNNETAADTYDVQRLGIGALGVWRPAGERQREHGFFGVAGLGVELERSLLHPCAYVDGASCFARGPVSEHYLGSHFAARLGFGYSWRLFEFRLGALAALPDGNVEYAKPVALPDVLLRIGERRWGWLDVGVGAYDASTNLRPGIYIGGALGSDKLVRVTAHAGVHFVNGLCCSTVTSAGLRYELGAAHAFSESLSGGFGVALMQTAANRGNFFTAEGRAQLTWAL